MRIMDLAGAEEYAQTIVAEQRNLLDVLLQYPSVTVSLTGVVEHLPRCETNEHSSTLLHKAICLVTAF
jgi:hypothetical protein